MNMDVQMSQKILVHAAYPLWRKNLLVAIARAKQLQTEGNEVQLTYCNAKVGTCAVNYFGNPLTCAACKSVVCQSAQDAGLELVPLEPYAESKVVVSQSEKSELVEGVFSGLISTFRLMGNDVSATPLLKRIKTLYYRTSLGLLRAFRQLVEAEQPDHIEVFNGRHACSKFPLIVARNAGIPFATFEITRRGRPILFHGYTFHDRKAIQERMLQHEPDLEAADRFFSNLRSRKHNKFATVHVDLKPPADTGSSQKVTFFLSSKDEYASLGRHWKSVFDDNAAVIGRACEARPQDFFCVRFHPNQAGIGSDYTAPFQALTQYPNLKMYLPTDGISTYDLIDWSDVVVTFGSTVTVEACWAGKPTILLGPSRYDQLKVALTPESVEKFLDALDHPVPIGNRENAARFVQYALNAGDHIPGLESRNGKLHAESIRLKRLVPAKLMRYVEVLACRMVKSCVKRPHTQISEERRAA